MPSSSSALDGAVCFLLAANERHRLTCIDNPKISASVVVVVVVVDVVDVVKHKT